MMIVTIPAVVTGTESIRQEFDFATGPLATIVE